MITFEFMSLTNHTHRTTTDTKHIKFGLFYSNPDDHRLLVPRQILKMPGYTLNFAKPISYLLFVIIILILTAAVYFLTTISIDNVATNKSGQIIH